MMLRGLAKFALLSGRTAVWPSLRCSQPLWNNTWRPVDPCSFNMTDREMHAAGVSSRYDFVAHGPLDNMTCM